MSVLTAEAVAKSYSGRRVVNGVNIEVKAVKLSVCLAQMAQENHDVSYHGRLGST
jgi:ABC-type lipopolysaccharide export system ATPase subunit